LGTSISLLLQKEHTQGREIRLREESEQEQYLGAEEEEESDLSEPCPRAALRNTEDGFFFSDSEERGFIRFE
jgi:hypothetical protein